MAEQLAFTPDQQAVMSHRRGNLQIVACPGSGKTEVVSQRIARLIEGGVAPNTIVAFTFTDNAADELKARIRRILDERCPNRADFGDMFVGTIHSFCFQTIKELDPVFRSFNVLDDPKRIAYLAKNYYNGIGLVRLQRHHGLSYYDTIERFANSADVVMDECADPADLSDSRFRECYEAYRKCLADDRYFDFSSSILEFVELAEKNSGVRKLLASRIKHVVVDEYQDVNQLQERLVRILSNTADSLCVVGDDDQNIFHWRGSDVNIIRTFARRYRKRGRVETANLFTNFRSTGAVIDTAASLIGRNRKRLAKKMVPSPKLLRPYEEGDVVLHQFPDDGEELKFIAAKIRALHGTDFLGRDNQPYSLAFSDFAVIVRRNDDAARVVAYLDSLGDIKAVASSGMGVFDRPEVRLALDCIGFCFGCEVWRDGTSEIPDIARLKQGYQQVFDRKRFPKANVGRFATDIKRVKGEVGAMYTRGEGRDYLPELGLQGFFHRILSAMGAEEFDFGDVIHYNLACLSSAISDYESVWIRLRASQVRYFFGFVSAFAKTHYTEASHSGSATVDAVQVLTIHKAKGLEFPAVFLPYFVKRGRRHDSDLFVTDDEYPSGRYSEDDEDRRRLYYTALTRSEKYLFVTGSERLEGKKRAYKMHPFADELDRRFLSEKLSTPKPRSGHPPRLKAEGVFPTSFSELDCYNRCPEDFRFRHVLEYNAGVPVTFGFGTNVHNALNQIHTDFIREKHVPSEVEVDALVDRIFTARYATPPIAEKMRAAVKAIVRNYVSRHQSDFAQVLETEKRFEFVSGRALVAGQIDLLKKVGPDGRPTEVEIIDFKTERNDGVYKEHYDEQLRFYALACLESLGYRPQSAKVHHLEDDTITEVDISAPELERTRTEITSRVDGILSRRFVATPQRTLCEGCDYRLLCPSKGFRIPPGPAQGGGSG